MSELLPMSYDDMISTIRDGSLVLDASALEQLARWRINGLGTLFHCLDAAVVITDGRLEIKHEALARVLMPVAAYDPREWGLRPAVSRIIARVAKIATAKGSPSLVAAARNIIDELDASASASLKEAVSGRGAPQREHYLWPLSVLLILHEHDSFEALHHYLSAGVLDTPTGRTVAKTLILQLSIGHSPASEYVRYDGKPWPLPALDPRWFDACTSQLASGDDELRTIALQALRKGGPQVLRNAADAVAAGRPKRAKQLRPAVPTAPRYLARYRAGEHESVWKDLADLRETVWDPAVHTEALEVARETMTRVRRNAENVAARLGQHGYKLKATKKRAVGSPAKDVASKLAALSKAVGARVPISLQAFFEIVGSIDLREDANRAYDDDELLFEQLGLQDPLHISALNREVIDLAKRSRDSDKELPVELRDAPKIYVGQGENKYTPEDGDDRPFYLRIEEPVGADAIVSSRGHLALPFVDLLRHYFRWGGFPGLDAYRRAPDADPDWNGLQILTADLEAF